MLVTALSALIGSFCIFGVGAFRASRLGGCFRDCSFFFVGGFLFCFVFLFICLFRVLLFFVFVLQVFSGIIPCISYSTLGYGNSNC